jgi:hypothetical protein
MTDDPESDDALDADLARARDAIAAPPAPLDDVTRRRLVTRALAQQPATAPRRTSGSRAWRGAAVAAAALVVVGLGVGLLVAGISGGSGGSAGSKAASQGATLTTTARSASSALGEVAQPRTLLDRVRSLLANRGNSTAPSLAPPAARCVASVHPPAGVTAQPLGTATYRGAPAVVVVARDGASTFVYVLDAADCRLLTTQFFRE